MATSPDGDRKNGDGFWEAGPETAKGNLEGYRVIDVRQPEEFTGELGHIGGAELVPLGSLMDDCEDWDQSQPLLIVCRSGARSHRACLALQDEGFQHVTNLVGGMIAWNKQGFDVER